MSTKDVEAAANASAFDGAAKMAETVIADSTANPAPLGLMGFGLTTILLNLHNMGLFGLGSAILAMGIFYGGVAQIIAGAMEWKKKNTFGMVAFSSYGLFWLSLVGIIVLPKFTGLKGPSSMAMVAYLALWGLFTLVLFIGTLKMHRGIQVVFFLLTILFILLALGDVMHSAAIDRFAGIEGVLCGLSAVYVGAAEILNEVYGRTILPLGE